MGLLFIQKSHFYALITFLILDNECNLYRTRIYFKTSILGFYKEYLKKSVHDGKVCMIQGIIHHIMSISYGCEYPDYWVIFT